MKKLISVFFLFFTFVSSVVAAPPVPFSGKLAVDGKNFHGNALFAFSIVDGEGKIYWNHSEKPGATIENFVLNGRYLVLLGGQGMQTLPANLFLENDNLFLRVRVNLLDGQGIRLLEPDQPITSTPYALAAELAQLAERATEADGVRSGSITASMLQPSLLEDLNRTTELGEITRDMLPQDVRNDLNATITRDRLSQNVRDELNATITRDRLSDDVRADLNRTVRLQDLSPEVSQSINRSITLNDLDSQVITELNNSIATGSISLDQLSQQVRNDLNATITRERLSQNVRDELNATITRDRLSSDVLADLNRTVRLQDLSPEVSQSINRSITLSDLDSQVITELNNSIATGSISLDQLSQQVRSDLNRTITKSMLAEDIKNDLNRTITLGDLAPEVIADLNDSIQQGSITLDLLSSQVRNDINRTITKSMLSQEVLDELNATIGPSKLSSEVSNALKPVVVGQPSSVVEVGGNPAYLAVEVDGVNLSYQWKKNEVDIAGATSRTLSISDLNASQHEGNYTVVVSNPFGSATSSVAQIDVNGSLTEGLVGWWKFDETEGNIAYDSSGNERDGNFSAGGSWVNGKIGGALDLNGSTSVQILNYKGVLGTTARSISMWLKSGSENGGGLFIWGGSNSEGNVHYYALGISTTGGLHNSDYGSLKLALSAGFFVGTQKVNTNEWFHVVVVSEENSNVVNSKLFLNLSEDTALKSMSKMINTVSDRDVTLGDDLDGLLDDVRIYDRALSVFEVKALYELGEQPVQEGGSGTTTVVNGTVANGAIGLSKLSSEVSNALKPVVVSQPSSVVEVGGATAYLSVGATGGDNTYQWKKNGVDITGATSGTLSISDLNASQHEGNYTVVVSNAFGSVTSSVAQIDVNGSLTEGLVGWWKFDETEGNIASDSSGNGNDGNLTNGPTWTEGKFGGALNFDGENDLLKLPSTILNGITGFSASFHFLENLNNTDHHHFISVANASTANRFILGLESNYEFNINDSITGASLLNYQSTHNFINWSPIAVSRNSSTTKLFISGILVSYASHSGDSLTISENGLWVGGDQDSVGGGWGATQQLNGSIDDLRIYDRALTAFEIKSLHELGEQPVQESGAGTTTVVNGTIADGSITASKIADQTITTNQLSEQILKYLKPEITQQPTATTIFADTNASFSVSAEGKYLTYQWKKNGANLAGETNASLTITDANATQHEGNYTVVVSNDFGSVESGENPLNILNSETNGLVGWWKFDETSGTVAYDSSGNGNNGNLNNGPTWVTGKIGGALTFDGVDDFVEVSSRSWNINNTLSISLWYLNQNDSNYGTAYSLGWGDANDEVLLFLSNQLARIYLHKSAQNYAAASVTPSVDIWDNIVCSASGGFLESQMKIFVNGDHVSSNYSTSGSPALLSDSQDRTLRFGRRVNSNPKYYKGSIDEVRMYDRALSAAEVQALYQLGQ